MRNPQGYIIITNETAVIEHDTATCCHCNRVFVPKINPGGFCMRCMNPICSRCANNPECVPLMKQIEEAERRDKFLKEVGI